jgi:hypothetical protein
MSKHAMMPWEAYKRESGYKGALYKMQSTVVLQGMFCDRLSSQLASQEEKKQGKKHEQLVGVGEGSSTQLRVQLIYMLKGRNMGAICLSLRGSRESEYPLVTTLGGMCEVCNKAIGVGTKAL